MSDSEKALASKKACQIIYQVLIVIRNQDYTAESSKLQSDLADLIHNLPRFVLGWDDVAGETFGDWITDFSKHYPKYEFLSDQLQRIWAVSTEEEFTENYAPKYGPWPSPEMETISA